MEVHWQLFRYQLPLYRPLSMLGAQHDCREGLLLRLEDSAGGIGWGEIAPLPGLHSESLTFCQEHLPTVLVNDQITSIAPSVRFGVDMAFRLLQASRDYPTPAAWVQPQPPRVPVNGLLPQDESGLADECRRLTASGFQAVKLKVGLGTVEEAIARVQAVREHLGPEVALRVDANASWSWEQACCFAEGTVDSAIAYCEEPLKNRENLAALHEVTGLRLALDEMLWQAPQEVKTYLAGLHAIILKPSVLGSWEATASWVEWAQQHKVEVVFSSAFESGMGTFWLAMMALLLSPNPQPCGLDPYSWLAEDVLTEPLLWEDGHLCLPQEWPTVDLSNLERLQGGRIHLRQ